MDFSRLSITFVHPGYLVLLAIIPAVIWFSRRSLAGLGPVRQVLAIALRSVVLLLVILALAELQQVRRNDRLAVLFLLDQSQSVPAEHRQSMLGYVNRAIEKQKPRNDQAGVIVFGSSPRVELPPMEGPPPLSAVESLVDREHTDLAAALKLAQALFPENRARRIVVVSDGNQNRGDALRQAELAHDAGVQIDVVPIEYHYDSEVIVEKVTIPADIRRDETVNLKVVIRSEQPASGRLQLLMKAEGTVVDSAEQRVTLKKGPNAFTVRQQIKEPNFYTFEANFIPDEGAGDRIADNNLARSFTHVQGTAQALLIEPQAGDHRVLVSRLRQEGLEVTAVVPAQAPKSIGELQPYDTVILANVPREAFSEEQIKMFEANTHDMGGGLVMIGGPQSFGAGNWMNTPVEKAMPVDMEIKSYQVQGKGALVMIMHASEIPEGNYWQKVIAKNALGALSPFDYVGLLYWGGMSMGELFPFQEVGQKRQMMLQRIDRMTPQDMPDFDPGLQKAYSDIINKAKDAMQRRIIVISDGDPAPPTPGVVRSLASAGIAVTTVAVAAHGPMDLSRMSSLAAQTKGNFYNVTNPRALPRIFQKEARLVSRPLTYEREQGWRPQTVPSASEIMSDIRGQLPPINGFILTTPKPNTLAQIPIVSPLPDGQENPVLAHWTYGLGKSVAFTSDAGGKWTSEWPAWNAYNNFWVKMIRWSMRSVERGNFTVATQQEGDRVRVVVDALDKNEEFLNFLRLSGTVVRPKMESLPVELEQVGPGRYEATFDAADAGAYFISLGYRGAAGQQGVLRSGVNIDYSPEFRELEANRPLLEQLANVTGGKTIDGRNTAELLETDVFRHDLPPSTSSRDMWHWLVFWAVVLFLFDVGVRRIAPDVDRMRKWAREAWARLRGRELGPAKVEYMERLRSRKAAVADELDRKRAAARFEPEPTAPVAVAGPSRPVTAAADESRAPSRAAAPQPEIAPTTPGTQETYTSRLLKAKQKVWEEREKK